MGQLVEDMHPSTWTSHSPRTLPVSDISPVMAKFCRSARPVASDSSAEVMVQPADGPSYPVSQAPLISPARPDLGCGAFGYVHVDFRREEEPIAGKALRKELFGKRIGNGRAFLHHVAQLAWRPELHARYGANIDAD